MTEFPNRYDDPVDELDDDDDDFDLWMEMSEEEQDRELEASVRELNDFIKSMSAPQLYRWRRRNALRSCISQRNFIKSLGFEFFREHLRSAQKRLVTIRINYYQGLEVGTDD